MIEIVRVTLDNWREFKKIRLEAFKQESVAFSTSFDIAKGYSDDYWIDMVRDSNNIILIAMDGNKVVGVMRAALKDEDVDEGTAFVGSAYVNKGYRGKGIGKLLMSALIEEIKMHKEIHAIRLWVNEKQEIAISLYKGFGFEFVKEDVQEDGVKELIYELVI